MTFRRRRPSSRQLMAASALMLGVTLLLPLWSTHMEAPQYRDEEALEVRVYPGRIEGDVHEIETLNQYVGVELPLDTPELRASPWILGALLLAACIAVVLPPRARRRTALAMAIAMLGVAVAGGALLQRRLYEMGHVRGESILEGVPDFTPPILGSAKIANFTVHMSLGAGGWAYATAMTLVLAAFFVGRRERTLGGEVDAAPPSHDERVRQEGAPALKRMRSWTIS